MNRSINLPIRDRTIDNIRGFAIFLVVVGHCIMRFYETDAAFINNYWFRLIYSFHMPLFMFVGGWVAWLTFDGTLKKLKKRALALLIPFVVWNVVNTLYLWIIDGGWDNGYWRYLAMGQGFLWFFYSMFLCYVLLYTLLKLPETLQAVAAIVLCAFMQFVHLKIFELGLVNWYFFFFICGYFVSKYKRLNPIKNSWGLAITLCAAGVVLGSIWHPSMLVDCPHLAFIAQNKYLLLVWRYTVPLTLIAACFSLFYMIANHWHADRIGQTIGRYIMEIYIQNYAWICLIVRIWNDPSLYWLETAVITAVTLTSSVYLAKQIEKNKKLGFWLLGKQQ